MSDQILTNVANNVTNQIKAINMDFITIAVVSIVIIVILVFYYIRNKTNLPNTNCANIRSLYPTMPKIQPLQNQRSKYYGLRDYYIKTAYNCCCSGNFKDDVVGLCALENCIKQGVRCLDFQIYSLNQMPVIAASSLSEFTIKETYNYIDFVDAMNTIMRMAFTASGCPNFSDPLILHFRISSKNLGIQNIMAATLQSVLGDRLLTEYRNENNGLNLGSVPIDQFFGKIIIIVNKHKHTLVENVPNSSIPSLYEYTNLTSGSAFMHQFRYNTILYADDTGLKEFNKKNMTISLPNLSPINTNQSFAVVQKWGCQMCAMNFQNNDSNMEYYNSFFTSAFMLKPAELRFIPITINVPDPPPEKLSYKPRGITSDFYQYTI